MANPKFKPIPPTPKGAKGKNVPQAKADKTLENSKGQTTKDIFNKNFSPDQIAEIFADPKQMQRILPSVFSNLVSIEKLINPKSSLDSKSRNTLLGLPGSGLGGGYGGNPVEGYLQFERSDKPVEKIDSPAGDPTLKDPKRVERASNQKFVKVSQQAESSEIELLKKYENGPEIAKKLVREILNQNTKNPNDQVAFNNIVSKYQKEYTNDLKTFFADTEPGQNILSKITPKR